MHDEIDFSILSIQHIIERLPNPNWEMAGTIEPDVYVLGVALSGKATYTINGQTYLVEEGGLVLVPPRAVRTAHSFPGDPWHFITIGCQLQFAGPDAEAAFSQLPRYFPTVPGSIKSKARELHHVWNGHVRSRTLLAKGLIYEIFHILIEQWDRQQYETPHYDRIARALAHIQQHYASQIRQAELAKLCGYSEPHFRRLFRSITGMSCSQYILCLRVDIAKNLLLSGTATVSEAANLTGFSDIYHFSKMFKKVTGHSPSRFKA